MPQTENNSIKEEIEEVKFENCLTEKSSKRSKLEEIKEDADNEDYFYNH